ncbi:MAG: 50S ribosomal protein L15 [Myxococcota bacterium]
MGTELHDLQPAPGARQRKQRVGRGIGSRRGKTSTRGMKGQLARHNSMKASFEGGQLPIHRRVPKRGFINIHRVEFHGINVGQIEGNFAANEEVTVEALLAKGLIPKKARLVKLLGTGELKTALKIKLHRASKSAAEKVEAAGGSLDLQPTRPAKADAPAEG